MRMVIIGGAVFIGSALARSCIAKGGTVTVVDLKRSRVEGVESIEKDLLNESIPAAALEGADAVIHLTGSTIFGRWNQQVKEDMHNSRIVPVARAVESIGKASNPPKAFICASAVGYYGEGGELEITEESRAGYGYLAELCREWEATAAKVERFGVRRVSIRTGLVLGRGGLLKAVSPLFKLGLGGPIGTGKQWMSWINIDDIIAAYEHAAMTGSTLSGPVNACAPNPVRYEEFARTLAGILHRPSFIRVSRPLLKLALGEFADEILKSQKAMPKKLLESGFTFAHPLLEEALRAALR